MNEERRGRGELYFLSQTIGVKQVARLGRSKEGSNYGSESVFNVPDVSDLYKIIVQLLPSALVSVSLEK